MGPATAPARSTSTSPSSTEPECSCARKEKGGPKSALFLNTGSLGRARDRNEERLAHHVLSFDQLLCAAPLLVEHHGRKLLQRVASLVDGAAVRVDAGQLLDESDVTAVGLQVYGGEGEPACFHLIPPNEQFESLRHYSFKSMTMSLQVTFQNGCGHTHHKYFALRKLLRCFPVAAEKICCAAFVFLSDLDLFFQQLFFL